MVAYRDENGLCNYCGSGEDSHHSVDCVIYAVNQQHHDIVHEVLFETENQLIKWDVQDHPLGNGPKRVFPLLGGLASELEHRFRDHLGRRFQQGRGDYFDILFEEMFEAFAAETDQEVEDELIQVAAVAVAMVSANRRKRANKQ